MRQNTHDYKDKFPLKNFYIYSIGFLNNNNKKYRKKQLRKILKKMTLKTEI